MTMPHGNDVAGEPPQHAAHGGFRRFMVLHQYKVLPASVALGSLLAFVYRWLSLPWFLSRLILLLTIIAFVPAGLVLLAHLREFWIGRGFWWDKSDVVWTTYRSRRVEKVEIIVMSVLWSLIFLFVIVVIFILSRPR